MERSSELNVLDKIMHLCVIYVYGEAAPNGYEGNVFVFPNGHTGATQLSVSYKGEIVSIRTYNWTTSSWSSWKNL